MTVLIKYDIVKEFVEDEFYKIKFDYTKASNILSMENNKNKYMQSVDQFLKDIDGVLITMQFRGISKIDNLPIFVIDCVKTIREHKLKQLLK
jgi:hypothetical protein